MSHILELNAVRDASRAAVEGLLAVAGLKSGNIVVVGCSTSEVAGERIGTGSNAAVAEAILAGLRPPLEDRGIHLAVQCCEHLNRALVVEESCAEQYRLEPVSAVPHPGAGGAFATLAYQRCASPLLVESIRADAGLDIGDTFIGMHLKPVAVPVRLAQRDIGLAHLTLARTRPRLIGGKRARYAD
jgi:uncharacterized protein (TIGR01440 family)